MQSLPKTETMVVKNTFLEISDSSSLLSGGFSRQMSEPAKKVSCWSRQISLQSQATVSEWDEWDDERTTTGGRETPKSGAASASSSSVYGYQANEAHELLYGAPHGAARAHAEQLQAKASAPQPPPRLGGAHAGLSVYTVTMRGVPAGYTKQLVAGELQDAGFSSGRDFDFLYVPSVPLSPGDETTNCFVNFTSATVMNAFCSAFGGRKMRKFNGRKPVQVTITTPEDLVSLMLPPGGAGPAPGPGAGPSIAAAPQGIPAAPSAAPPPVQISLQGVAPPAPSLLLNTAPPTTPPQAWCQLGTQPRPPVAGLHAANGHQQPAAARPVIFCPSCGTKGQGEFRFCSRCGFHVQSVR